MANIQSHFGRKLSYRYPHMILEDTKIPKLRYNISEPRLIIREMELENYKSYCGICKVGPFHKNFSSIIGPNGSGKSNIIDSLMFVFDFKASKIRSEKLSALIHKSELFPNVQSCSVRVYFQRIIPTGENDDDYQIVDDSKFVVSRTAFKDNSNLYKINDGNVGAEEIAEFLRKQGIDLDQNRFLLLQGEVEQISEMEPKAATEYDVGLLEYLEDIIGSHRFKTPINILKKRLEKLDNLRTKKFNEMKIAEKEKKTYKGVLNDGWRYWEYLIMMKNKAEEKVVKCKEEMKKIATMELSKKNSVKEIVQQRLIAMQEFEKSKKQSKELEIEGATLRDSRKHCELKIEETKKLIKLKENELAKYENVPEEKSANLLKEEILMKQEKIKPIQSERDLLMEEEEKLAHIEKNLKLIKEIMSRDKNDLQRLNVDLPKMEKEYAALLKELDQSKKIYKTVEAEMHEIQPQLDSPSSFEVDEKTINFLFEQQSQGHLKNIIGRLGNLASVDPQYDVALSTACGRLDNIVTETIDDAQSCAELMKKYNVGNSIFIAMDKVEQWRSRAKAVFRGPANIPRAFDVLNIPDERFRPLFYFALQDLLVAKDINEARRINNESKQKYRIVTLQGDLLEMSGAITGGGNRVIQGKISTNSDKVAAAAARRDQANTINKNELDQKYKEKKHKYEQLSQLINELSDKLDKLQLNIEEAKILQKDCNDRIQLSVCQKSSLLQEREAVKNNIKKLEFDNSKLDKTIKQLSAFYEKDPLKVEEMSTDANKLKDEITNMGVAKLSCIKSQLNSVETIKEESDTLKKINENDKNAKKNRLRTSQALEDLSKEKTQLEANIIEMDNTLKELDILASINVKEYEKTNKDVDELAKVKEEKEKELREINEDLRKLDLYQIETQRICDVKKGQLNRCTYKLTQINEFIDLMEVYDNPEESETSADELLIDFEDNVNIERPNVEAIERYLLLKERCRLRAAELTDVREIRDSQLQQVEQLKKQRLDEFLAGFNMINGKLKEVYRLLTLRGDAEMELGNYDTFSEGIDFTVFPPDKCWKKISNLTVGEKTLASLALVFALHHFKPSPFYVMDEMDAALDSKNVSVVANYIKERTRNAQFIIISSRNNMYTRADRLIEIQPDNDDNLLAQDDQELQPDNDVPIEVPVDIDIVNNVPTPVLEALFDVDFDMEQ